MWGWNISLRRATIAYAVEYLFKDVKRRVAFFYVAFV